MLEALSRTCSRQETIVVFASDNGAINDCPIHGTDKYPGWQESYARLGSNLPFRGVKGQLYEGGVRTPTVVNWRGTLEPATMEHPVHVTDWMPTFSRLVDAPPEGDPAWDGQDIWPLVAGEQPKPEQRTIYWNFAGASRCALRQGPWKLIRRRGEDCTERELYNIATDPYEKTDLAEKQPERVDALEEVMEQQAASDGSSARDDVDSPRMP
jgi:arylsulfatase A-like enzyme